MKCIGPKAVDADFWIKFAKNCVICGRKTVIEVEHVKAHRTDEERQHVSLFEKFIAEGNEKAEEMAKEGAMLAGGSMSKARARTIQQEREEVHANLQCAAGFHCLVEEWKDCEELQPQPKEKWIFVHEKRAESKHRTEWCAVTSRYREMWKRQ